MSYGFRYPDSVATFNKTVAHYVSHAMSSTDNRLMIVVPEQRSMFYSIFAFAPREVQIAMLREIDDSRFDTKDQLVFENVIVSNECPKAREEDTTYIVRHDFLMCGLADEGIAIKDPRDAAPIFRIFSDQVCQGMDLMQWRSPSYITDFGYDGMDRETFCRRWVSDRT